MPELESLLGRLIEHRVEFVVVGGFAAVAQGATLLTQDLDICLAFSRENLEKLRQALADLEPVHRLTPQRLPFELTNRLAADLRNLYLDTRWGPLDCLGDVKGLGGFTEVLRYSEEVDVAGGTCRILGLEGLILAKEAMDRPQDHLALLQLRAIRERRRA
jgi:hypothetical protein